MDKGTKSVTERPIDPVIREFKKKIKRIYGKRLRSIVLYGSWARNEAKDHSDIDRLVVLSGRVTRPGREIDRMMDIILNIGLKYDRLLSIFPVSYNAYKRRQSPLLINVRKEGVEI